MIQITRSPIDIPAVLASVSSPQAGAVVLFLGTTRQFTGERQTQSLDYDCYEQMAAAKLAELESEACRRWPLVGCAVVHRVGRVDVGQVSVAIAVSSQHRGPAFEAGQWLIDTLKETVPIWKQEHWTDGTSQWIHPGLPGNPDPS
jgi:molybdopterin synthase catalytic subunit